MQNEIAFFSYSRNDSTFALKLAKDLRKAGVKLWIDQLDIRPGSHWDASIENGLNAANCMIVILTPDSIASNNVMDEVSYALESGKRVIPILWKQCNTPFRLRRLQRIDFTGEYNDGITQLLEALDYPVDSVFPLAKSEAKQPPEQPLTSQQETRTQEKNKVVSSVNEIKQAEKAAEQVTREEIRKKSEIEIAKPSGQEKQNQEIDLKLHQIVAEAMVVGKTKTTPIQVGDQDLTESDKRNQISGRSGAFHPQKLMSTIIASMILLSMFFPWVVFDYYYGGTLTGLKLIFNSEGTIGLFVLLCYAWSFAIILLSAIGNRGQAFKGYKKFMTVTAFILLIVSAILIFIQLEDHSVKPAGGLLMTFILGLFGLLFASGILRFGAGAAVFHKQRLNLVVIAMIALISSFLSWINYGYGGVTVIQMHAIGFPLIGWLLLLLSMGAMTIPFIGNKSESIKGALKVSAILLFSLMICFVIYIIGSISIKGYDSAIKPGIGAWLSLLSALVGLFVLLRVIKLGSTNAASTII